MNRQYAMRMITRLREVSALIGLRGAIGYVRGERLNSGPMKALHVRGIKSPMYFRPGTSDLAVFHQVFIEDEYRPVTASVEPRDKMLVIDCGANVGYSTLYFLRSYPAAKVIAVEPDPSNAAVLRANVAAYADRVEIHETGVWATRARLQVAEPTFRDGKEWSRQVMPSDGDGDASSFDAVTIGDLLSGSGFDRITILKMDIEGAEAVVLKDPNEDWMKQVDCVAIELHDDTDFGPATEAFHAAFGHFELKSSGELCVGFATEGR